MAREQGILHILPAGLVTDRPQQYVVEAEIKQPIKVVAVDIEAMIQRRRCVVLSGLLQSHTLRCRAPAAKNLNLMSWRSTPSASLGL